MKARIAPAILALILLSLPLCARPKDKCSDFSTDVRIQHIKYFGVHYPWWYGVGQLRQESRCRAGARAFDGGMGVAQFMPKTAEAISKQMGIKLDPFVADDAIKMQAFFIYQLHKQNKSGYLRYTYQAYNGGWTLLFRESKRAGSWDPFLMRAACQRKTIVLKSGALLSFCTVNYDYPIQIQKYASPFRLGADGMRY